MYLLLVFLPVIGSLFAGFFGRFLGKRGSAIVSTFSVFSTFLLSLLAFYEVGFSGSVCHIKLSPWFCSEMFDCAWGFYFDTLTVVMLVVISSVSTLVHVYSVSYMENDPHLPRFMSYLSIFTFFMLTLVTADNAVQMFFGWEGVGLASYLLINFWFTRLQASKASIKAMLMNRIGDFGLALGIMGLFSVFKTVDFPTIFASAPYLMNDTFIFCNTPFKTLEVVCLLLFIGGVGKSAQLGLHTWLPDAMEGPTPVSALIHAATMVTAGVFMIARLSPLFEYAPSSLSVITILGACTCLFAATTGLLQNDLKRVIAYSTCSQLGYMVFACGLSAYSVAVFHLANHAFFKALLFLSAGSVIHSLSDIQDMRKMGGLVQLLPFTYTMTLIGSLSLAGIPFLTGFYSKDVILECGFASYTISGHFAYYIGSICVLFTSVYSFRLIFLSFLGENNSYKNALKELHESPSLIFYPLTFLALGSIFIGYFGKDMMIGSGTSFWGSSIFVLPENFSLLTESEFIPQPLKLLPLLLIFAGVFITYTCSFNTFFSKVHFFYLFKTSFLGRKMYYALNKRWFFDKLYNDLVAEKSLSFGYKISFKTLDKGFFEILGPYGISRFFIKSTRYIAGFQTGLIYHYAVVMLIGLTVLITIVGVWDFLEVFIDNRLYFLFLTTFLFYNYYSKAE